MTHLLADTDPGTDDAIALAVASVYFKDSISAMISTYGNTVNDTTFANLVNLNSLLGINTKVICGANQKIGSSEPQPTLDGYHGQYGLCGVKLPECTPSIPKSEDFLKGLYEHIVECKSVYYVAVGPLTNLALLLEKYPDVKDYIKEALIMGGGFDISNTANSTEFNFANDPTAVKIVLQSGIDIKLFPLDTTHKLALSKDEVCDIIGRQEHDIDESDICAYALLSRIFYGNFSTAVRHGESGSIMHDTAPFLYLIDGIEHTELRKKIDVDEHGRTYCSDKGYDVTVVEFAYNRQMKEVLENTFSVL